MSIFPFINPVAYTEETPTKELEMFQEYAYDFNNNCLLTNVKGETYLVSGNEALRIWIYKALLTERFNYIAYSNALGNEAQTLIGSSLDYDIAVSEIRRFIIESLIFNPYLRAVSGFVFQRLNAGIEVQFEVTSIYGNMTIGYTQKGADG